MKLSFVIPTVNQYKLLFDQCVSSFRQHHGDEHELIVVDDGSTAFQDRTPIVGSAQKMVEEECLRRGVKFLKNDVNSGFAVTVNKGIRAATGDIITVINNDIKFTHSITKGIVESFSKDEKIGIAGALLFYPDGTIQHGGMQVVGDAAFTHRGWHRKIDQAPEVSKPSYLIGVTGAVFSLRKQMIDEIGAFREDYFLACEDTEFCLRAWSKGWRVYYNPEIQAIHLEGATRGRTDVEKQRKHRAWYIKEQQTFQRFRADLKKLSIPDINRQVALANGIAPTQRIPSDRDGNAEKIVFGSDAQVSVDQSSLKESESIFIRRSGALGDVLMETGVVR
jgi:GT2 family glycosyltransferase